MLANDGPIRPRVGATELGRGDIVVTLLVALSVVLVGANLPIKHGVTLGVLPIVFLAPVWLPTLRHHRGASLVTVIAGLAVIAGFVLGRVSTDDHMVSQTQALTASLIVVTGFGAVGVLLWAASLLRERDVLILFTLALIVAQLLNHGSWAANPWKYGFAFPITVAALAFARTAQSIWPSLVVFGASGLLSILSDYRSFFSFCLIASLLLIWQRASPSKAQGHKFAPFLLIGAIAYGGYYLLSSLIVGGYFGAEVQQRSIEQIQASGSLLVGGRPEWAATVKIMALQPQGFGFGVVPNAVDVGAGDAGLTSVNVNPDFGYNAYMFTGQFRLHSIVADLWVSCGVAGIILALAVFLVAGHRLLVALADRTADALLLLLVSIVMWDLFFSPIYTNMKDVTLALFVVFASRRSSDKPGIESERRDAVVDIDAPAAASTSFEGFGLLGNQSSMATFRKSR